MNPWFFLLFVRWCSGWIYNCIHCFLPQGWNDCGCWMISLCFRNKEEMDFQKHWLKQARIIVHKPMPADLSWKLLLTITLETLCIPKPGSNWIPNSTGITGISKMHLLHRLLHCFLDLFVLNLFMRIPLLLLLMSFHLPAFSQLLPGIWRRNNLNDSTSLPFNFQAYDKNLDLINGEERINVQDIQLHNDSVIIPLPIFNTEFRCLSNGQSLSGNFYNYTRKTTTIYSPFHAEQNVQYRFSEKPAPSLECNRKMAGNIWWWRSGIKNGGSYSSTEQEPFIGNISDNHRWLPLSGWWSKWQSISLSAFDGSHLFSLYGQYSKTVHLSVTFTRIALPWNLERFS